MLKMAAINGQQRFQRKREEAWSSYLSDEEGNTVPALQFQRRHTDTFLSGDGKLTNRLKLLYGSKSPKTSSPTMSGNSKGNQKRGTGRHSISNHEAMNSPLLSSGKPSLKADSNHDQDLENVFAINSKKIRKRRSSVGSVGKDDDTYQSGAWTIKTDGLRLIPRRGKPSINNNEATNSPLVSSGKLSLKADSNVDQDLENFFVINSKKIRKRRGSVGSVGNDDDTYKSGAWTIKTDGLRLIPRRGKPAISNNEATNSPLVSSGKPSLKTDSNVDQVLDNFFAMNSKKIRKRRASVGSVGNDDDTYKSGAWTIKTDGLRFKGGRHSTGRRGSVGRRGSIGRSTIDKDETKSVHAKPVPVYVKPLESCVKPQATLPSLPTHEPSPVPRKSCLKPPKSETTTNTGTLDSRRKTYKESKAKRTKGTKSLLSSCVIPEGYAVQLNVHTGQVEHLCVTTNAQEKSAPEVTMGSAKSASYGYSPRTVHELDVRFLHSPTRMSNSAA